MFFLCILMILLHVVECNHEQTVCNVAVSKNSQLTKTQDTYGTATRFNYVLPWIEAQTSQNIYIGEFVIRHDMLAPASIINLGSDCGASQSYQNIGLSTTTPVIDVDQLEIRTQVKFSQNIKGTTSICLQTNVMCFMWISTTFSKTRDLANPISFSQNYMIKVDFISPFLDPYPIIKRTLYREDSQYLTASNIHDCFTLLDPELRYKHTYLFEQNNLLWTDNITLPDSNQIYLSGSNIIIKNNTYPKDIRLTFNVIYKLSTDGSSTYYNQGSVVEQAEFYLCDDCLNVGCESFKNFGNQSYIIQEMPQGQIKVLQFPTDSSIDNKCWTLENYTMTQEFANQNYSCSDVKCTQVSFVPYETMQPFRFTLVAFMQRVTNVQQKKQFPIISAEVEINCTIPTLNPLKPIVWQNPFILRSNETMVTSENELRSLFISGAAFLHPWKLLWEKNYQCTTDQWTYTQIIKLSGYQLLINATEPILSQRLCLQLENQCNQTINKLLEIEICGKETLFLLEDPIFFDLLVLKEKTNSLSIKHDFRKVFKSSSQRCIFNETAGLELKEQTAPFKYSDPQDKYLVEFKYDPKECELQVNHKHPKLTEMLFGEIHEIIMFIEGQTIGNVKAQYKFSIKVQNELSDPPTFEKSPFSSELTVDIDFGLEKSEQVDKTFVSEVATDIDGNDILMTFKGPSFAKFVRNKNDSFSVIVKRSAFNSSEERGTFYCLVTLGDIYTAVQNIYEFKIVVIKALIQTEKKIIETPIKSGADLFLDLLKNRISNKSKQIVSPPIMQISKIDDEHRFNISFDQPMLVPAQILPEIQYEQMFRIMVISSDDLSYRYADTVTNLIQHRFSVNYADDEVSAASYLQFNWTVVQHQPTFIQIQLNFKDRSYVSKEQQDVLKVEIWDTQMLVSADSLIEVQSYTNGCANQFQKNVVCRYIPKVLLVEGLKNINDATQGFQEIIEGAILANMATGLLLSGSLFFIWGMIRGMQYILTIMLIELRLPDLVLVFFQGLVVIASLDIFQGEQITSSIFSFSNSDPFNDIYDSYGISTQNFLLNTGSIFVPILIVMILKFAISKIINKIARRYRTNSIMRQIGVASYPSSIDFLPAIITFFQESYFELAIALHIQLRAMVYSNNSYFNTFGEIIQIILLAATLAGQVILPLIPLNLLSKELDKDFVKQKLFIIYYKSLFEGLKNNKKAMIFQSIFLIHRQFTAVVIVWLFQVPLIQCQLLMFANIYMLQFSLGTKQFYKPIQNRFEILTNYNIAISCYIILLVSNPNIEEQRQEELGILLLVNCGSNILVYLVWMSVDQLNSIIKWVSLQNKKLKRYLRHKKHIQNRKIITQYFPTEYQGFELFLKEKEAWVQIQKWKKIRTWMSQVNVNFKDLPEEADFLITIKNFAIGKRARMLSDNLEKRTEALQKLKIEKQEEKSKLVDAKIKSSRSQHLKKWMKSTKNMGTIEEVEMEFTQTEHFNDEKEKEVSLPQLVLDPAKDFTNDIIKLKRHRNKIIPQSVRFLSYDKKTRDKIMKAIDEEIQMTTEDLKYYTKSLRKQEKLMELELLHEDPNKPEIPVEEIQSEQSDDNVDLAEFADQDEIQTIPVEKVRLEQERIEIKNFLSNETEQMIKPYSFVGINGIASKPQESYVVSILQCLMAIPIFSDYYSRKRYKPHIPTNSQGLQRQHKITTFLHDFFRDMLSLYTGNINEAKAIDIPYLQEFIQKLSCSKEPVEVLKFILRSVDSEFKPDQKDQCFDSEMDLIKSVELFRKNNFSLLSKCFNSLYRYRQLCEDKTCLPHLTKYESKSVITLQYKTQNNLTEQLSLIELLDDFHFEGDAKKNQIKCYKCNKVLEHSQMELIQAPIFFAIRINRFRPGGDRRSYQLIEIPEQLNLSSFIRKKDQDQISTLKIDQSSAHNVQLQNIIDGFQRTKSNKLYDLHCCVSHRGNSLQQGKFISFTKRRISNFFNMENEQRYINAKMKNQVKSEPIQEDTEEFKWFEFQEDLHRVVEIKEVLETAKQDGLMLIYKKQF